MARTLRQVVQLVPQLGAGTFTYAIQSSQGIATGSNSSITGDIYANQQIELGNSQTLIGSIYSQNNVKLGSNATITNNIWAKGEIDLDSSSSVVQGSVTTQGNIKLKGTIGTSAVATGSIDNYPGVCSKVGGGNGTCKQYTQVEAPPVQSLPTFQYVASNYPGSVTYPTGEDMVTALANKTFSGTHYANSNATFDKNNKWYLTGDTTILINGHITLPGTVVNQNPDGQTISLRVISTSTGDIVPSNNLTIPANVHTLLYGGKVGANGPSNSIQLTGNVAAIDMSLGASFNITYAPVTMIPGFTFNGNQPVTHYNIRNVSTREIPTG